MDDPISRGFAFEVGNLFRKSIFHEDGRDDSIFPPLDTDVPSLEPLKSGTQAHFDLTLDLPNLPGLENDLVPREEAIEEVSKHESATGEHAEVPAIDIWDVDLDCGSGDLPQFCTWEAFEKQDVPDAAGPALLSEAGPAAFDASLKYIEKSIGVLPQDYVLRALSSLIMGRSSSLFQWDDSTRQFETTLEGAALSGLSLQCTSSVVDGLKQAGQTFAVLREFSVSSYKTRADCSALMALRSCVSDILDAVDGTVSSRLINIRSVLQLQELITRPYELLRLVHTLVERARTLKFDESVISAVSDQIHQDAERAPLFASTFRSLLTRVSVPWLEELSVDLGFSVSITRPDRDQRTIVQSDGPRLTFLDGKDEDLIRETKAAVAVLRQQYPAHPILEQHKDTSEAICANRSRGVGNDNQVAWQYEQTKIAAISSIAIRNTRSSTTQSDVTDVSLWQDETCEAYLLDLEATMSTLPRKNMAQPSKELQSTVEDVLQSEEGQLQAEAGQGLGSHFSISPIGHVRPLIHVQHRLVNGILLRALLRTHDLPYHLGLQKSFQMLGTGNFVSRLSTALFSKEVQSAERRRGVIPTAETMGLRVGATKDQRWPPASSELQLTLIGLLREETSTSSRIRDSLSFAIRELPEEEIDQVLDPHSIYALDFLRLQYTATPPLDTVITKNALDQYDSVFSYLLKLQRVLHAVGDLPRRADNTSDRSAPATSTLSLFRHDAHQFLTTLLSHAMDICVFSPWQSFMRTLATLSRHLDAEDAAGEIGTKAKIGIEGLKKLHEATLDNIRTRLFLKRKLVKLKEGIEAVLSAILKVVTVVQQREKKSEEDDASALDAGDVVYQEYKQAVERLLVMLREVGDKPLRSVDAGEAEDLEALRMLLARVEAGRHYGGEAR